MSISDNRRLTSDKSDLSIHGSSQLCQILIDRMIDTIDRQITFAEFMEAALYDPDHGYYAKQSTQIGTRGDFITSPHLGAEFGELIAIQLIEMWTLLDKPAVYTIVELGAGQGLLAQDILSYLQRQAPDCFAASHYTIVERSGALVRSQQAHLKAWLDQAYPLSWKSSIEQIERNSIIGCVLSNELFDAFAVHQVITLAGRLQEIYVTWDGEYFVERVGELSTPQLQTYFDDLDLNLQHYPEPYRTEVNLQALDCINTLADRVHTGYVISIDYGYSAERYYSRTRTGGTLQCYHQHRHHNNPYIHIGQQDITTHVNFTALIQQGERVDLQTLGITQQASFLMALGLGNQLSQLANSNSTDPQEIMGRLKRREALHSLINPLGLGSFGVLIQVKGPIPQDQPLQGLLMPIW